MFFYYDGINNKVTLYIFILSSIFIFYTKAIKQENYELSVVYLHKLWDFVL